MELGVGVEAANDKAEALIIVLREQALQSRRNLFFINEKS